MPHRGDIVAHMYDELMNCGGQRRWRFIPYNCLNNFRVVCLGSGRNLAWLHVHHENPLKPGILGRFKFLLKAYF